MYGAEGADPVDEQSKLSALQSENLHLGNELKLADKRAL